MTHEEFLTIFQELSQTLPKFEDGRVDYTDSDKAPVVTCFVKYKNEILLLKRGDQVHSYKNLWNVIGGYFDELKTIQEKILEELIEETGIQDVSLDAIILRQPYIVTDQDATWYVCPALVELDHKPTITLDREHTDFAWVSVDDLDKYDMIPDLQKHIQEILG